MILILTYNKNRTEATSEMEFIISYSGFVKYVNNHVEETVELEDILNYLGLTEILYSKMKAENYKKGFKSYIRRQYKITVEGSKKPKVIKGFYLTVEELANNLFSFNIDFSETTTN